LIARSARLTGIGSILGATEAKVFLNPEEQASRIFYREKPVQHGVGNEQEKVPISKAAGLEEQKAHEAATTHRQNWRTHHLFSHVPLLTPLTPR